jgi:hypothetical protein
MRDEASLEVLAGREFEYSGSDSAGGDFRNLGTEAKVTAVPADK